VFTARCGLCLLRDANCIYCTVRTVYCAVRTVFTARCGLCLLRGADCSFVHTLDEYVFIGLRPPSAEARVRSQAMPCETCGDQTGKGTGFRPSTPFPLSVSFHQCCRLIFIYMLRSWEGQTGETWEPSKKQCSFWNRVVLGRKVPSLCSVHKVRRHNFCTSGGGKYASFFMRQRKKYKDLYRMRKKVCNS
jgi:hypothetical protein